MHSARLLSVATLLILGQSSLAAEPMVTAAAFAPDGRSVVVGSQAGLEVRSWPELKSLRTIKTGLAHVHDLAFNPAGDVLAVAGGSPGEEGGVELLRWPSGENLKSIVEHEDVAHAVAWRPDGKAWASASSDTTCRVHDAATGKLLAELKGHSRPVLACAFTPDGKQLLSAGIDQSLRVWDAATARQLRSLENHTGPIHALAVRPLAEGPVMVATAGADRTIRLWQPTVGRMVRFARLPAPLLVVQWSPDGSRLLLGDTEGRLRVLDPDSLEVTHEERIVEGWLPTLAIPMKGDEALAGGEKGQARRFKPAR